MATGRGLWRERAETALIVTLALLVVIKGFGTLAGVLMALGDMFSVLWDIAFGGD